MKGIVGEYSIIREDVEIGEGSRIWHFCNLYGCRIGRNTQIGSYCEIKEGAIVGDDCRIQSYVFIPEYTEIGNDVFIGHGVIFANDRYPSIKTWRDNTWIMKFFITQTRTWRRETFRTLDVVNYYYMIRHITERRKNWKLKEN